MPYLQIPCTGEQGFEENSGDTVQSVAPAPHFSSAALTSQFLRHHTPIHTLDRAIAVPCRECSASQTSTVSFLSFKSQSKCYCNSSEWPSLAAQGQACCPVTLSQHPVSVLSTDSKPLMGMYSCICSLGCLPIPTT